MRLRYFYKLNAGGVLKLFLRKPHARVYYFNSSKAAEALLNLFKVGSFLSYVKFLDFALFDVKNKNKESYFPKIHAKDLIELCNLIETRIIKRDPFIISLKKIFDNEHVFTFFKKIANQDLQEIITYINVIKWHYEIVNNWQPEQVEFYIEKPRYYSILQKFAQERFNIRLVPSLPITGILRQIDKSAKNVFISLTLIIALFKDLFKKKRRESCPPMLGLAYLGIGASFELTGRCEFPWLLVSDIPLKQTLIYFRRKDIPVSESTIELFREKGIKHYALEKNKNSPKNLILYQPTGKAARKAIKLFFRLCLIVIKEIKGFRCKWLTYITDSWSFMLSFASAFDFYGSNNIKITVNFDNYDHFRIPEHCALNSLGGVSVSYQLSNWPLPNVSLAPCTDITFLFGPYYRRILSEGRGCASNLVYCGYLTDYAFSAAKEESASLRNALRKNGAQFIISYFDENSSDDRFSVISNSTSAKIYKTFLEWVISDKTLGLICSPKKPSTLIGRLPEIKDLLENAKTTGRCIFMDGRYRTNCYPVTPAQASDLAVALLIGGTVGLESFLAGVRTVYLDLEGLYSYPEYQEGKNKIVFDNLKALMESIEKFRSDSAKHDEYGNIKLIENIQDKDLFHDGKAAARLGEYILWMLNKIESCGEKKEVIAYANRNYSRRWGSDKIAQCSAWDEN